MEIFLRALYGWSFTISSFEQLDRIVKMADYYRALPAFSSALDGAFLRSPALIEAIHELPHRLIEVAAQLQNEILYRECLIQRTGPWTMPKYNMIRDRALREIAEAAYRRIGRMVLDTQYKILNNLDTMMRNNPGDQRVINYQASQRALAMQCGT